MAKIEINDASVSYFLRKGGVKKGVERGAVGGQILIGRRYLEIAALKNVTLSFEAGDRVGLIGINGSGKSTLLQLCAGALTAHRGSVTIEGKVSPQFGLGSGIKPNLSGRRNAELKCLYLGTPMRSIPERIEEVKELSGLGGYFELPVSSYSAGMKSRLVMSLMRLVRGDILVMDEWIGAADASLNQTMNKLQSNLVNASSILIMASHSQRVLEEWTNKLVWIDRGEIRATGTMDDVYAEYREWMKSRK